MEQMGAFLPLILIFAVFYILLIRPQQKKQQESRKMLDELKEGDQVVTLSGFHGTIKKIKDDTVMLQIADNVRVKFKNKLLLNLLQKNKMNNQKVFCQEYLIKIKIKKWKIILHGNG